MEFSGKDLEDIQRVAGLLNLTVDELLQQSRDRTHHATPVTSPRQPSPQHCISQTQSPFSVDIGPAQRQPAPGPNLDPFDFEVPQSESPAADPIGSSPPLPARHSGTQVILLNPQSPWYDCDAALLDFNESFGGDLGLDGSNYPDTDTASSYVPVEAMQTDSRSTSENTAREEGLMSPMDDASTDWALVSPPESLAFRTPASPSTGSTDKRYYMIAPRSSKSSALTSENSSYRVKKKRRPYEGTKKTDTHLTRQVHACVRCRMQRNRCIPDPKNPRGPCLTCQQRTVRMSRLPCLRYMVTDSTLFRTGLDYMPFYKTHPMVGPHYGDFHLERQWIDGPSKFLCLGQVGSMHFQVELKQFVPPANSGDVDLKGRPMYAVPWAIADPDAVVKDISEYIDRGMTRYMSAYLDDTDELVWNIFQAAYRASVFPLPNDMLKKTLRLWVACRFIESKWRCWTEGGWADSEIRATNPQDPFYKDLDSLPPYLDYQIASIIIHRILSPLRKDVLRDLQSTFNVHSPKDWFATFLCSFILLQNYEMQMQFQRQFAERRRAKVQYLDMPLVRATNSGAKTILAHFHYCYKGQQLFTQGFDWNAPRVRRMARLDVEQTTFMSQCRDVVVKKTQMFAKINQSNLYHEKWWYTSQLFDSDWTPRDTLEHAPLTERGAGNVA
ncbi:hypothetical protein MMYC01_200182 [Madurella mycetomatis]|uniref:Zn(2)-C6 fungal-type domain-containing protein n=1 Tax=Madurella mycetomatis TaxID=100816 RepID=A0A175VZF9_9PEZI|nr:hypothetical protein MMYC01_206808 [Madurella mycetomatis]KXX83243.1 hypothetical protein MMYC01_200182 [Madurella mycetomatis]